MEEGERLASASYVRLMEEKIFPWSRETYGENWRWQQDGARPHTAQNMQDFLAANAPRFIDKPWPPYSLDLSPLDLGVFGHL